MSEPVLLHRDGVVATLTLNRPEVLNTLDFAMVDALVARTAEIAADDSLRVVVLRGAGKHFMAGGDVRTFAGELAHPPATRQADFQRMVERVHAAIEHLHRMPHPVVGRVHGAVAGIGLSFMNACDLVVAADNAYFTSAYRHIALTPDGGGSWTLPRLVGLRKAMEILLLSERFDAAEALRLGLVNRVVAADALDAEVDAIRPRARHGARSGDAQCETTGPRFAGAHAVRAAAGGSRQLRPMHGDRRFCRRHHGVHRKAPARASARAERGAWPALHGKTLVHHRRLARHRPRHRAARGARRRQCRDRGEDRRSRIPSCRERFIRRPRRSRRPAARRCRSPATSATRPRCAPRWPQRRARSAASTSSSTTRAPSASPARWRRR